MIYAISDGHAIKIGRSKNVAGRIAELQTGNPNVLKLICAYDCKWCSDRAEEKTLHRLLDRHRMRGEWFEDCYAVHSILGKRKDMNTHYNRMSTWFYEKVPNLLDCKCCICKRPLFNNLDTVIIPDVGVVQEVAFTHAGRCHDQYESKHGRQPWHHFWQWKEWHDERRTGRQRSA